MSALALLAIASRRRIGAAARRRVRTATTPKEAARQPITAPTEAADRRAGGPGQAADAARRGPATAGTPAERTRVVGYALAREPHELERCAGAIRRACSDHGWTLACLVRDGGTAPRRPGLAYALDQVSKEMTPRLVVSRLEHVARSARDVAALLAWCARLGVVLVVLDVGLDTGTREGRLFARRLLAAAGREAARRTAGLPRRSGLRTNGRPTRAERGKSDGA